MSDVPGIALQLVQANYNDYAATTDRLIENLRRQLREAGAHRQAVEAGVTRLLSGPYMPTSAAIEQAVFWPSQGLIDRLLSEESGP